MKRSKGETSRTNVRLSKERKKERKRNKNIILLRTRDPCALGRRVSFRGYVITALKKKRKKNARDQL